MDCVVKDDIKKIGDISIMMCENGYFYLTNYKTLDQQQFLV